MELEVLGSLELLLSTNIFFLCFNSWCPNGDKQIDKLAAAGENFSLQSSLFLFYFLRCGCCYFKELDMVHMVDGLHRWGLQVTLMIHYMNVLILVTWVWLTIVWLQILTDNVIERLPMNLGKLQSLKVMALDGNRITTLPDECKSLHLEMGEPELN